MRAADGVVLPGVGAFPRAMEAVRGARARRAAARTARRRACRSSASASGCSCSSRSSTELGGAKGIGLLEGTVEPLHAPGLKVPHIGWNPVSFSASRRSRWGCPTPAPSTTCTRSRRGLRVRRRARHGRPTASEFVSVVARPPVYGTQFHPEKSGPDGLRLLGSFAGLCVGAPHDPHARGGHPRWARGAPAPGPVRRRDGLRGRSARGGPRLRRRRRQVPARGGPRRGARGPADEPAPARADRDRHPTCPSSTAAGLRSLDSIKDAPGRRGGLGRGRHRRLHGPGLLSSRRRAGLWAAPDRGGRRPRRPVSLSGWTEQTDVAAGGADRAVCSTRARRSSSTRTSTSTACSRAWRSTRSGASRTVVRGALHHLRWHQLARRPARAAGPAACQPAGVISGKALYEGRFTVAEAQAVLEPQVPGARPLR